MPGSVTSNASTAAANPNAVFEPGWPTLAEADDPIVDSYDHSSILSASISPLTRSRTGEVVRSERPGPLHNHPLRTPAAPAEIGTYSGDHLSHNVL
jgi:hypothetical protein